MRLAAGTNPLLSPNGRWVDYRGGSLSRPSALRLISSQGGAPRVPRSPPILSCGRRTRDCYVCRARVACRSWTPARSAPRRFEYPKGSGSFPFSPDASRVVFERSTGSGTDIYTISTASGAIRRLTEGGRSGYPLWGPGGIAFERFGADPCANCHGDVWLMNPSGDDVRQLTHTHASIYPAAWSGDGTRMLAAYPAINNRQALRRRRRRRPSGALFLSSSRAPRRR